MILFLDFDGVLHPEYAADVVFCNLPCFEAVMRDHPDVESVISSMRCGHGFRPISRPDHWRNAGHAPHR